MLVQNQQATAEESSVVARLSSDPDRTERRGDRRIVLRRRVIVATAILPQTEHTPAVIFDISRTGVGLLAIVSLEPGMQLTLDWEFGPKRYHRILQARVIHATVGRDGGWRVGCAFDTPLEPKELRAFLRHCARL